MTSLMKIENLSVSYRQDGSWLDAVRHVTFSIDRGEVFGLVGESGCGKSTLALQLLGYSLSSPRGCRPRQIRRHRDFAWPKGAAGSVAGAFLFHRIRLRTESGDPRGDLVAEMILQHGAASGKAAAKRLPPFRRQTAEPGTGFRRFSHQLSGGSTAGRDRNGPVLRSRHGCPDEPTTGLDVTTQRRIVALLANLRASRGLAMLYVTHDLALLRTIADRVGVMYAGDLVETAETELLFTRPRHPYTIGLLASIPSIAGGKRANFHLRGFLRREEIPPGCPFQPRCDRATLECIQRRPQMENVDPGHFVACWRWQDGPKGEVSSNETAVQPR